MSSPEDLINEFEQIVNPLYQDISAMFADGVPFFIDADSLLLMVMADKQWRCQFRGSSLHLVYLIESYLNIFAERGGEFHLIFFETWKNIWHLEPTVLLYRQILMEHFRNNTKYHVHVLNNCLEKDFANLISTFRPQFILTNFDMDSHCQRYGEAVEQHARLMIVQEILTCLYLDLPCVDTNGLRTEIFNVQAFYTVGSVKIMRLVQFMHSKFEKYFNKPIADIEFIDTSEFPKIDLIDSRSIIILLAAKRFSEKIENNRDSIIRIILLNYAIMDSLNLENRSCPILKYDNKVHLDSYIKSWHSCLFEAMMSIYKIQDVKINWNFVSDLWQGLLFGHLCRFLKNDIRDSTNLGITVSKKYEVLISKLSALNVQIEPYPISSAFLETQFHGDYQPKEICLGK